MAPSPPVFCKGIRHVPARRLNKLYQRDRSRQRRAGL